MLKYLATLMDLAHRVFKRLRMYVMRHLFGSYGDGFRFDPDGLYSYTNIHVGKRVNLGYQPILLATESEIRIGDHVMFGPQVMVLGGNHNTSKTCAFMADSQEKRPDDDLGVIIEDDVWVGGRSILLNGVTIGRGSIIGAGSLVNRPIPPYAIAVGNPARVVRLRWDIDTILVHESALYPPNLRYSREALEAWQQDANIFNPATPN